MHEALVRQLVGKKVSMTKHIHGSISHIGFGEEITKEVTLRGKLRTDVRCEWLLVLYLCEWEMAVDDDILVDSDDSQDDIKDVLKMLNGKKVVEAELRRDCLDLFLSFEGNLNLETFASPSKKDERWWLFTPQRKVLKASDKLLYTSENE